MQTIFMVCSSFQCNRLHTKIKFEINQYRALTERKPNVKLNTLNISMLQKIRELQIFNNNVSTVITFCFDYILHIVLPPHPFMGIKV